LDVSGIAECWVLKKESMSSHSAKIVFRVLETRRMLDGLRDDDHGIRPSYQPEWEKSYLYGEIFQKRWDDFGWMWEFWDMGEGVLDESDLFYTDTNNVDHLLSSTRCDFDRNEDDYLNFEYGSHENRNSIIRNKLLDGALSVNNGQFWYNLIWNTTILIQCEPKDTGFWLNEKTIGKFDFPNRVCNSQNIFIWDDSFHSESLEEILLPYGICLIGENAFSDCPHLKRVIFPDRCEIDPFSIAPNAFVGCSKELTFSVSKTSEKLIAWLVRHGFCVEERDEGVLDPKKDYPEMILEPDEPGTVIPKLKKAAAEKNKSTQISLEERYLDVDIEAEDAVKYSKKHRKKRGR